MSAAKSAWRWLAAALLLSACFGALGVWQLQRAAEKTARQAEWAARPSLPVLALGSTDVADAQLRFRRAQGRGRYLAGHEFLLLNRPHAGRNGFEVYTPFEMTGGAALLLVDRGWIESARVSQLPAVPPPPAESLLISGLLAEPANPGLRLGTIEAAGVWPRAVTWLDTDAAARALGRPVLGAVLLLDAAQPGGFLREWQVEIDGFGPQRHQAYAFQWFALALTVLVTWYALNRRRASASGEGESVCT
ncbi:SURF1 family protein [Plasticicumulans acidivorans]|uniref:SURF1-like protein n=1 Tax=Plasticicumulans acidivorans TaxID=886464 RepID=A0A317N053_9GAMM|nr:SURF1 family protein [Plasticicumulans acidivorans]PWV61700.1 cytochrome oxidase assembly protein ShyY1 [Plasticicumulans acidivorans]